MLAGTTVTFAQKKEVKNAEKAVEDKAYTEAVEYLKQAEPNLAELNDKYQARFYMAKGQAYLNISKKDQSIEGFKIAGESFKKAKELGEEEAQKGLDAIAQALVNGGIADRDAQKFESAYKKLYAAYQMNPSDTIYLYAAANNAYSAENDKVAIDYYSQLQNMGYTGAGTLYMATNKASGEQESFNSKEQRDLFVKTGQYSDPVDETQESKAPDVVKHLAFLYLRNDQQDKALEAVNAVKKADPNDVSILKVEAIIYQKMGKNDKYKTLITNLIQKDPDEADTYYNILGDWAFNEKQYDASKGYYKQAVEANPENADAYSGLANVILTKQMDIVKQMNSLGMSAADNKKYNELSKKRKALLKEALPYMEKSLKLNPDNANLIQSLYQLNMQLGNTEKAKEYKAMMN